MTRNKTKENIFLMQVNRKLHKLTIESGNLAYQGKLKASRCVINEINFFSKLGSLNMN